MDRAVLDEWSLFVEHEEEVQWVSVPSPVRELEAVGIPAAWAGLLSQPASAGIVVAQLWQGTQARLPRTAGLYSSRVHGLAVLHTRARGASLVYSFRMKNGDLTLRRGFPPADVLPDVASRFPIDLSPLYSVHDGLVDFCSFDGGPIPSAEWGSLVAAGESDPTLVIVAQDGSRSFGFDVSHNPVQSYEVQPDEDDVAVIADPWAFLDELMAPGWLEECDLAHINQADATNRKYG
ncbi:hypothetical protein H1V43_39965 [Streptomyces sp. PSKA54]|uniref:Uncharacterized protein n=1 Tax=Streptomyces himalayensis subsp. aureolus TaxID=2758039 RepID=A0A7W2DA13_9ACTN|nr:hypothetical protein [Streptomyces himalayensis]MBA4867338.1 hypothetical protein [Streptomyces himalayensis subsp. aureolus]